MQVVCIPPKTKHSITCESCRQLGIRIPPLVKIRLPNHIPIFLCLSCLDELLHKINHTRNKIIKHG